MPRIIETTQFNTQPETYLAALEQYAKPPESIRLQRWANWNKVTGGFRLREFSILCGSTGAGKTTFLANLSSQLILSGVKHFVMSVETGHVDFMKRVHSCLCGQDLNTGEVIDAKRLAVLDKQYGDLLRQDLCDFSLYDNRIPVEQLIYDIQHMQSKRGCKIVMVDNLNFFMEVTTQAQSVVEMDRVVHELIMLTKRCDVHIVMVMHPKKTEGNSTRVVNEYNIKGSSTAVQEAHNVFLFNRPKDEDVESGCRSSTDRELYVAKMRMRGAYVGKTLIFENFNTQYIEKGFV